MTNNFMMLTLAAEAMAGRSGTSRFRKESVGAKGRIYTEGQRVARREGLQASAENYFYDQRWMIVKWRWIMAGLDSKRAGLGWGSRECWWEGRLWEGNPEGLVEGEGIDFWLAIWPRKYNLSSIIHAMEEPKSCLLFACFRLYLNHL